MFNHFKTFVIIVLAIIIFKEYLIMEQVVSISFIFIGKIKEKKTKNFKLNLTINYKYFLSFLKTTIGLLLYSKFSLSK
jgi:hypothetical protein